MVLSPPRQNLTDCCGAEGRLDRAVVALASACGGQIASDVTPRGALLAWLRNPKAAAEREGGSQLTDRGRELLFQMP